jgi:hypothetical protein
MDKKILNFYIAQYKNNFEQISKEEIYKWEAIKQFKDNFDVNVANFYKNFELSLSKSFNLLGSGNYFARRMILKNTEKSPDIVRKLFKDLYNEEEDILQRIQDFIVRIGELNRKNFGNINDFQDHRAVVVYLTFRYPERYYLYKFNMFKDFAEKVKYPYRPIKGRISNIGEYFTLCELVKYELENDQELIKLHQMRLNYECYRDREHHILTQDFIYSICNSLKNIKYINKENERKERIKIRMVNSDELEGIELEVDFSPKTTNIQHIERENKRIGDLGELFVKQYEEKRLKESGNSELVKKVIHIAKDKGDGLGYDIKSCDNNGKEIFIEVKTTTGKEKNVFFLTKNELERSKIEKEDFYLYRVYEFDYEKNTGKILIIRGDLSRLCENPIKYRIKIK